MSTNKMFKLAYLKWKWIIDNWRDDGYIFSDCGKAIHCYNQRMLLKYLSKLKGMHGNCSFCERYESDYCHSCPLYKYTNIRCYDYDSLYNRAFNQLDKNAAIKLRDIIKQLWDDHKKGG
jgi:hypothetical protein